jgi:hypothetical protein
VINAQFIQPILGVHQTIFVHSEGDTRDAVELMDYYTKGIAWGIYNPNEVRSKMGMAPANGGDVNGIMAPTGFVPLDRLNLFFQIPKTNVETIDPVPEDPIEGEPMPKPTSDASTAISREAVKGEGLQEKYDNAREGMFLLLQTEQPEKREIIKAYTYFNEARGIEPEFETIYNLLEKSIETENALLQEGYFSRIQDEFNTWIARKDAA